MPAKHRFTVRKMTSGYTGVVKWYVYDLVGKGRVTVHAYLGRDSAQAEADGLNIIEMTVPAANDPRPFEVRHAEAAQRYYASKGD